MQLERLASGTLDKPSHKLTSPPRRRHTHTIPPSDGGTGKRRLSKDWILHVCNRVWGGTDGYVCTMYNVRSACIRFSVKLKCLTPLVNIIIEVEIHVPTVCIKGGPKRKFRLSPRGEGKSVRKYCTYVSNCLASPCLASPCLVTHKG